MSGGGNEQTVRQEADPFLRREGMQLHDDFRYWSMMNPYQSYGGQMVAGLDPMQQQAAGMLSSGLGPNAAQTGAQQVATDLGGFQAPNVRAPTAMYGGDVTARMVRAPQAQTATAGYAGNVAAPTAGYAGDVRSPVAQFANSVAPGQVQAGSIAGGIGDFFNPYTEQVVDTALGDIERSRQMANASGARSADASTYGGDRNALIEAETNRAALEQSARTAAQLRSAGFSEAADRSAQQQAMGLQAGLANQSVGLQAGLANQSAFNQANQFNAGLGMQGALANQAARNQLGMFNSGLGLQAGLANQSALQNANQFNAGALNQGSQFNAGLGMQGALANQSAGLQAGLANQSARNQSNQYNAGLGMQAGLANQNAALQAGNLQLGAAGLLGSLGQQQFGNLLAGSSLLNQFGAQSRAVDQAGLSADYQQWLDAQNDPYRRFAFRQGILSGFPGNTTMITDQGSNRAAGAAGGLLSGAGTGAMIGSVVPGLGTGLGAGIGAGIGLLGGLF